MTTDDAESERALASPTFPHAIEVLGACAAALPFFVHFTTSSTRTVNGEAVEAVARDWVAVGGGAVALLAGLVSLAMARSTWGEGRGKRRAAGAALVAAGLFQLLLRGGLVA